MHEHAAYITNQIDRGKTLFVKPCPLFQGWEQGAM